jgi:hypothetical protein
MAGSVMLALPFSTCPANCRRKLASDSTLTVKSYQPKELWSSPSKYKSIGQAKQIVFLTEDVSTKYQEWLERGVVFLHAPREPAWGGIFTVFQDPDENSFVLVGFDEASRAVEE